MTIITIFIYNYYIFIHFFIWNISEITNILFQIIPVNPSCDDGGWVRLREGDSKGFLYMVAPTGSFAVDEWVVKVRYEIIL